MKYKSLELVLTFCIEKKNILMSQICLAVPHTLILCVSVCVCVCSEVRWVEVFGKEDTNNEGKLNVS